MGKRIKGDRLRSGHRFPFVMGSVGGKITTLGIRMFKAQPSSERDQEG